MFGIGMPEIGGDSGRGADRPWAKAPTRGGPAVWVKPLPNCAGQQAGSLKSSIMPRSWLDEEMRAAERNAQPNSTTLPTASSASPRSSETPEKESRDRRGQLGHGL